MKTALIIAALLGGFLMGPAHAHDGPMGWAYDAACCSGQDCAPLPENSVIERPDGYLLKETGELIEKAKARQGQDESYHLCRSVYSKTIYCIYLPIRGS
jgi:hypothetical protein